MTEQEWLDSKDPQAMLAWLIGNIAVEDFPELHTFVRPTDRKLRLFICACCRQMWPLLTDDAACFRYGYDKATSGHQDCDTCAGTGRVNRCRMAVQVAERYADGLATNQELSLAWRYARDGWGARNNAAGVAYYACHESAAYACGRITLPELTDLPPADVLADLLRHVMGNPWHKDRWDFLDKHIGFRPTTVQLAEAVYSGIDCAFALADALEEEGYVGAPAHFREPGHPKGCWALDLILGKE